MPRRPHTLSSWRLLVRSLAYHRGQTAAVAVMTALIAAGAIFAPWYTRMVDDAVTASAFGPGEMGSTVRMTSPGDSDLALEGMLTPESERLFDDPVDARHAFVLWDAPTVTKTVEGGLVWRDDICDRLEMIEGSCPAEQQGSTVQVAVSEADAERYTLGVGDVVPEIASAFEAVEFQVTGIYRLTDPEDPYWFDVLPTGRSGFRYEGLSEIPTSDLFVVAWSGMTFDSERPYQASLDIRVDADAVTAADVPALRREVSRLREAAPGAGASLVTATDDTFEYLDRSQQVTATTMTVTAAQVGVLALAVLAMLASVVLIQRRPETGLSRLRGMGFGPLVRWLAAQWAAVVVLGAVVGIGLGYAAALAARAAWLPGSPPLAPPVGAWVSLAAAVVAAVALLVLMARPVVREPVPALLRSTGPRAVAPGSSRLLIDGILATAALCGVAVGLQTPDDSALVLLAPSLLAVAASVLLARLLSGLAGRLAGRWLVRGRTSRALTGVLLARGRGTRLLLTVLCMSAAFAVFGTQLSTVGQDNRQHRAEVEAGADAVGRTGASPAAVVAALDEIDPDRERATLVISTGASGADALGTLFVEPEPFTRIAHGALDAATASDWSRIEAPAVAPPELTGRTVRLTVEPHRMRTENPGTKLSLRLDYLHPDGFVGTALLGTVPAVAAEPITLEAPISCARSCQVLRWSIDPDGPVKGRVTLGDISADGTPLDLGASDEWHTAPQAAGDARFVTGRGTLTVGGPSGGLPLAIQHAFLPVTLPVVLARDHPRTADNEFPTVLTPGGAVQPIAIAAEAREAIPRVLRGVAVADVATVLRTGDLRQSGRTDVQIWYADAAGRGSLDRELAELGVRVNPVDTLADHTAVHEGSAEALTGRLHPAAAAFALVLGLLAVVVSVAATWRARTRDFAALRMVGVRRRALLTAACGLYLVLVAAGTAVGAACGVLGFQLAIKRTPLFTVPEPEIPLDLAPDMLAGVWAVGLLLASLVLVSIGAGRWLVGRSSLDRIREAGE